MNHVHSAVSSWDLNDKRNIYQAYLRVRQTASAVGACELTERYDQYLQEMESLLDLSAADVQEFVHNLQANTDTTTIPSTGFWQWEGNYMDIKDPKTWTPEYMRSLYLGLLKMQKMWYLSGHKKMADHLGMHIEKARVAFNFSDAEVSEMIAEQEAYDDRLRTILIDLGMQPRA